MDCSALQKKDGNPADWLSKAQPNQPFGRILRPGMVTTIEPGLYVRAADDVPQAFWNLGIRIEDDVLVTETGCDVLTAVPSGLQVF